MALHNSGCRETVEGLPSVHSSSTTRNSGRATLRIVDVNCTCRVGKVETLAIKSYSVILLFRYSVFSGIPAGYKTNLTHYMLIVKFLFSHMYNYALC